MTGAKRYRFSPRAFWTNEDGAVTADWVVLAAAVALLSIPLLTAIKSSTQTASSEIATDMITATER